MTVCLTILGIFGTVFAIRWWWDRRVARKNLHQLKKQILKNLIISNRKTLGTDRD